MDKKEFKKALDCLSKADSVMKMLIKKVRLAPLEADQNYFKSLTESILSQQLNPKAANTIIARMVALFPKKKFPSPDDILKINPEKLRACGISYAKISYIKDLARHTKLKLIKYESFRKLSDEEIIRELVAVKGIGRWTAEMFLIFSLDRPDVFSLGDLGLKNAVQKLYGLRKEPNMAKLMEVSSKWKPYRSLASRYLWHSLDNKPAKKL